MADKFEKSIQDWYNNSRTADLKYLDLAENPKQKDYLHTITNNTSVIYDRLHLFTKVSLKHFYEVQSQNESLKKEVLNLKKAVSQLNDKFEQSINQPKPLTEEQVRLLVLEIAQQPKLVEKEALRLTADLEAKVVKVEKLLQSIKDYL